MSAEHQDWLYTSSSTRLVFEGRWCMGHGWRQRRGLRWLHSLGHRAHVLRNQSPQFTIPPLELP